MVVVHLVLILLILFALRCILFDRKARLKLPPGPWGLPFLGNMLQLVSYRHKEPHLICHELNQRYGPIMSFRIGVLNQVITSDYNLMREILTSDDFEDRFYNDYVGLRSYGKPLGVLLGTGESWREMRRFTTRTLRELGLFQPLFMQSMVKEEVIDLLKVIKQRLPSSSTDTIISIKHFFTPSVINILCRVKVGYRFTHDDPKLQKLINLTDELVRINPAFVNISMALPFLSGVTRFLIPHVRRMVKCTEAIQDFLQELLNDRRELGHYRKGTKQSFVDAFLNEIEQRREQVHPNFYTDQQFVIVALDLFLAGSETTANMLEWAIFLIVLHPHIQTKVQYEIDRVFGRDEPPNYQDRGQLPYVMAVLLEVQRFGNVSAQNVRSPIRDTKIGQYDIPKGSFTVINTYSYNFDPKHWSEPRKFKPERFIGSSGQLINTNRLLTFGLGKRACIGETLAKVSVFTFFTAILQSYRLVADPSHPLPSPWEPVSGTTLSPQPFYAKFIRRY